jgi:hypothetical protein
MTLCPKPSSVTCCITTLHRPSQTTLSKVLHAAWFATWKGLNCQVPSSWRTPTLLPPQSPTPLEELDVCYSFKVQQNLIDPAFVLQSCLCQPTGSSLTVPIHSQSTSPHPSNDSFSVDAPELAHQPIPISTTTTDPLVVPIPCTDSISPILLPI